MEISSVDLQEKINSGEKIIVEFWAEWCGPCRMMKPIFEKVSSENKTEVQMYTMNVDLNREIAMSLGIRSIPTTKVFNSGDNIDTRVGVLNELQINGMVNELIRRAKFHVHYITCDFLHFEFKRDILRIYNRKSFRYLGICFCHLL